MSESSNTTTNTNTNTTTNTSTSAEENDPIANMIRELEKINPGQILENLGKPVSIVLEDLKKLIPPMPQPKPRMEYPEFAELYNNNTLDIILKLKSEDQQDYRESRAAELRAINALLHTQSDTLGGIFKSFTDLTRLAPKKI